MTSKGETSDGITTDEGRFALGQQIIGEGVTLLSNNGALPLTGGSIKVNLLGQRAYDPVYGGTGSGSGDSSSAITLMQALNENGFEVNPAVDKAGVYKSAGKSDDGTGVGFSESKLELKDPDLSKYTGEASFERMKEFSDIAILVFGRAGGEGNDLTSFVSQDGRHYLQLSVNEEALVKKASETFGTVIVLFNGANTLELGFVETYDVDAALWIGNPGISGFPAVAQILNGTINPSGRLVDTFAYDVTSAPSWQNFGDATFANSPVIIAEGFSGTTEEVFHYVDYVEGIYVGYRWYETAAAEGFIDYDKTVQYPFGYGLSYSGFTQEIVGGTAKGATISPTDELTLKVKVTNTGSVPGKEVVQAYYTSPYTDYDKANGIEKSVVDLVAYAKTGVLQPGASETVTLSFKAEDMASYDETHANADGSKGSYMLDAGTYTLSVRANSHVLIDSVDVNVKKQHFYSGSDKRSTDLEPAVNRLQESERGVYLSRKDGFANYNEAMASVTNVADDALLALMNNEGAYDPALDTAVTKKYAEGVDYGKKGSLKLADMAGLPYDDPKWDELIRQISISDLVSLVTNGGWSTAAIESIGKVTTIDLDGPSGLNSMFDTSLKGTQYPACIVLAATWNADLAYEYGRTMANEFHQYGVSGWYAPGMNIHRSPFSGRNFEYYSEDPLISGVVAAQEVYGARLGGLYGYIKHYAFNDQETNRSKRLTTWLSEQAAREIYLKPFEMSVKDGEASALMTGMNHVGGVWAGESKALLTDILRNEWGFAGMTITDANEGDYMSALSDVNAAIRAGQDLWLGMGTTNISQSTDADIYYLQRAAKNVLYTQANAQLIEVTIRPWRTWLYVIDGVAVLGILACAYGMIRDIRRCKKQKAK